MIEESKIQQSFADTCKKTQTLNVVSRKCSYMDISSRKILMKAFSELQFNQCPLI